MEVTREVILDLLPLYLGGEGSAATRELVEAYLRQDPELAARVRARDVELFPSIGLAPPPEAELRSLVRTRRALGRLRWICALATAFTAIGLALRMDFEGGRLTTFRFLIVDHPVPFGTCLATAAALWIAYLLIRRRARSTGLA